MDLHTENKRLAAVLHTRRLTLRPVALDDIPAIVTGLSLWDVTQWLTNVPFPYTAHDAESYLAVIAADDGDSYWAIDAGEGLIGLISVRSELGYWLNYDYHGQGIMSEAADAVVAAYFDAGGTDLVSGYHLGNAASARVLGKLGFENTHVEIKTQVATQEPVEIQRMILTKAAWNNK